MKARSLAVTAALALGLAAGCAHPPASEPAEPGADPGPVPVTRAADVPPELRVPAPKDARGIRACALLTREQLVEVGLRPETAEERPGPAPSCVWSVAEDPGEFGLVGVGFAENPFLAGLYRVRHTFARFEPTTVAGHPAARTDRTEGSGCTYSVAVSDYQLLSVTGRGEGGPGPENCTRTIRMAELVLSNLPPLR